MRVLRNLVPFGGIVAVVMVATPSDGAPAASKGELVFKEARCFSCHGQMGGGGMGPALAGDPMLAVKQFVVAQILIGRGAMPAFADQLSDEQIAAVASYVRDSWDNDFGPVDAKLVAETRQLMKKAKQASARIAMPEK
jgi:mono/diheme cytochrome c family protein